MNKNTKLFIWGAATMLIVFWCIGCNLASKQAAENEDWYVMIKCDLGLIVSLVLYWVYADVVYEESKKKQIAELRHDLNEALSRIRELEEIHVQEVEKCENNRA